jgi:hypothetical protein
MKTDVEICRARPSGKGSRGCLVYGCEKTAVVVFEVGGGASDTNTHTSSLVLCSDHCTTLLRSVRDALYETVHERVFAESERFRARLPELLKSEFAGKWIVFRDNQVVSAHDDVESAYADGLKRFGLYGGQVITEVKEQEVVYIGPGR